MYVLNVKPSPTPAQAYTPGGETPGRGRKRFKPPVAVVKADVTANDLLPL